MSTRRSPLSLAFLLALLASLASAGARAQAPAGRAPAAQAAGANPFEAEQAELAREVARRGRSPRALIPMLELWRSWGEARPEVTLGHLERLAADRRLGPVNQAYARQLLGRGRMRTADPEGSAREFEAMGYLREWQTIGPFDNDGKRGFAEVFEPERLRMQRPDPEARFPGRERPVSWRAFPSSISHYGYIDLDALYRPNAGVCAYAETFVESPRAQPLSLWLGAGGAVAAWWNGEEVLREELYGQPDPDRHVALVGAHRGLNRLLLKVCVTEQTWGFFARLTDLRGAPAAGLVVRPIPTAEQIASVQAGHGVRLPQRGPEPPLVAFTRAVTGDRSMSEALADEAHPPTAQALDELSHFLAYTASYEASERTPYILIRAAVGREPTVDRLDFAASLAEHRGEAMRYAAQAASIAPTAPATLLLEARLRSAGPSPEDALAYLDRLPEGSVEAMEGSLLRAEVLMSLGLSETAWTVAHAAAARAPGSPLWVAAVAHAASAAGHTEELVALRRSLVSLRYDDLGSRRFLLSDALDRGDRAEALAQLAVYRRLAADRAGTYAFAASVHEALGQTAEAMAAYREGMELAPEDFPLRVAYAQTLLRQGQRDAAAGELRLALTFRPQDASTRELLEQLAPQRRADEERAADEATILARRSAQEGFPYTVLQDLTVNTVYESGLGSSFRQLAAQIHDAEGARRFRTYSISFDPDVQRISVRLARVYRGDQRLQATDTFERQLGEPWYRIYYDTRALVVVFPDLEPGDVVELRYRIDDVAPRNLFHDYYGDFHYLQQEHPITHMEYVLSTPTSRTFYFNEPTLEGLRHTQSAEGGRRTDRFVAENIPAFEAENNIPGLTSVAPYLHVSTYRTWEEVGRWYWGLIQDQLQADDRLRQTVHELVDGVPDLATRVARIYHWVLENTRYVALEFGIHGFLPYRVPQIVERGFGDCKDKASLIYTMLREAGIDARIVLTRTRRNGDIGQSPASLAVFDHAIAYVPELDLYLDGTAEHHGSTELPQMDQNVTVLLVGPNDARLTRTPVLPASRNLRTRRLQIALAADGSAEIRGTEIVRGNDAPGYRGRYQAEGTRAERYERVLQGLFGSGELLEQSMSHLEDFEAAPEIQFRVRVPQMAVRDGDRLRLPPSVIGGLQRMLARQPTRRLPLDLGGQSGYEEERTIRPPAGHRFVDTPRDGALESPFGRASLSATARGRELVIRSELMLTRDLIPPEEYPAFRAWIDQVDRLFGQRVGVGRESER